MSCKGLCDNYLEGGGVGKLEGGIGENDNKKRESPGGDFFQGGGGGLALILPLTVRWG